MPLNKYHKILKDKGWTVGKFILKDSIVTFKDNKKFIYNFKNNVLTLINKETKEPMLYEQGDVFIAETFTKYIEDFYDEVCKENVTQ